MPGKDISHDKRIEIITLIRLNQYSLKQISSMTNVGYSTVQRLSSRNATRQSVDSRRKGRCGRKRSTNRFDDSLLKRNLCQNPLASAVQLNNLITCGARQVCT